jgi:glycosyltransferase involved in cell wall biosynthesis
MKMTSQIPKIVFLSTFPPTQCGIATYTQDSINAIKKVYGDTIACEICEITKNGTVNTDRRLSIDSENILDYAIAAEEINKDSSVKLVHIQHEFGLFGGKLGNYLLNFLTNIEKPIVINFHSVMPNPNKELMAYVSILISYCTTVIVMTEASKKILIKHYNMDKNTIEYVPHGIHIVSYEAPKKIKKVFNLEDRIVLSTFGLLGSGKSIETALKALPEIIKHQPNVLYLVIGKTHPNNIINNRDDYRTYLEDLVRELHIENHVNFINRYLEIEELLSYLKATDVYLFTSKDPNQAVSGTFSYAMSCACPIVATSIPHTKEMLTSNAGILVDIGDSNQLAEATIKLLSNTKLRESMALAAFKKTRTSSWRNGALKQVNIYKKCIEENFEFNYKYPPIKLDHIKNMTTELGIVQFCKVSEPDISSGYTLDDNARALIAMCLHYRSFQKNSDISYINIYLTFIERCQKKSGTFINYVDKHNNVHIKNDYVNLEDSNTRAIWALGTVISMKKYLPNTIVQRATICLLKCYQWLNNILSPRSIGFAIKGLYLYYAVEKDASVKQLIENLSKNLITNYDINAKKKWKWFEEYMTYANSILPEAMLYTYKVTGNESYRRIAIESFDFLLSKMFVNNHFKVISNKSWYYKNTPPYPYGEQPIDATYTIQTLHLFYKNFKDPMYKTMMQTAFNWFLGKNHLNQIMYNPNTGGCYDGLEKENVNINQGAESTVCYLIARVIMEKYKVDSSEKLLQLIKPKEDVFSKITNN